VAKLFLKSATVAVFMMREDLSWKASRPAMRGTLTKGTFGRSRLCRPGPERNEFRADCRITAAWRNGRIAVEL